MSWNGIKNQANKSYIESWCEDMCIENYTINSQGEIDVDGNVDLRYGDFKELPYKFGSVSGYFDIDNNPNLKFLKNCPNEVGGYFSCGNCPQLDSLEGCPKEVYRSFYCYNCKRKFTKEEVNSLCEVKIDICC